MENGGIALSGSGTSGDSFANEAGLSVHPLTTPKLHVVLIDQRTFLNMLRSLHNIDGYQLPELNWGQQLDFVQNPVKYFIQADDEQQAAIWREIAKRQQPEATYAGIPLDDLARSGELGWHPGDEA